MTLNPLPFHDPGSEASGPRLSAVCIALNRTRSRPTLERLPLAAFPVLRLVDNGHSLTSYRGYMVLMMIPGCT